MLFLAGEGHGNCEKVRWTRRHPPMGRRGVTEYPKALKIKAAASWAHGDMSAVRRLFFFCRRAAVFTLELRYKYQNWKTLIFTSVSWIFQRNRIHRIDL